MAEFESPLYERCEDPACPYDYAYRLDGRKAPHYHFIGPGPAPTGGWDSRDDPGPTTDHA